MCCNYNFLLSLYKYLFTPQDFIAQCIGVRYVGFGVAVWAFGSAIGSLTAGQSVKYVKRFTLFIISTGLSVFLCLFLIFFERVESFPLVFSISFGFGISDGILKTAISCVCVCARTLVCACVGGWVHMCLCLCVHPIAYVRGEY